MLPQRLRGRRSRDLPRKIGEGRKHEFIFCRRVSVDRRPNREGVDLDRPAALLRGFLRLKCHCAPRVSTNTSADPAKWWEKRTRSSAIRTRLRYETMSMSPTGVVEGQ